MPGSRCSKSVSFNTASVPPRLPPLSGSVSGLWNPSVLIVLVAPAPLTRAPSSLLWPHAPSANDATLISAAANAALLSLLSISHRSHRRPNRATSALQGFLQPSSPARPTSRTPVSAASRSRLLGRAAVQPVG